MTIDITLTTLLKIILKLIITNDDKIRDEKLQCNINSEAKKVSALLWKNIKKYKIIMKKLLWNDHQKLL